MSVCPFSAAGDAPDAGVSLWDLGCCEFPRCDESVDLRARWFVRMDQAGDARASHRGWLSLRTPAPVHHLPPRTSSPNGTLSVPAAEGHPGAVRHRWARKCCNHSKLEEKAVGKAPYPAPEQKRIEVGDIHYLHGQELEFSMFGKK